MPKWVYPLAFAFLLYVIYSDAGNAGQMANGFAGFLGNLLGAVGDFLTGLFEGPSPTSDGLSTDGSVTLNGSQSSTTAPGVTLNGANVDSFGSATSDHTHVHNHD